MRLHSPEELFGFLLETRHPMRSLQDLWESYDHAIRAIDLYFESGIEPGTQILGMLNNDMLTAFTRADAARWSVIRPILNYMTNDLPASVWGNTESVEGWLSLTAEQRRERVQRFRAGHPNPNHHNTTNGSNGS